MLKKNKNIDWTSQGPNKKIKTNETFENTSTPSFKGIQLWLDGAQLVGQDGKNIQTWQSVQNVVSGGSSGIADMKSTGSQTNWPIVKEKILNNLPIVEFQPQHQMSNTINIALQNYTFAFVSRQLAGGVNRRVFIGNGNRLYGYWGGGKNRLYNEGWLDANAPLGSNDEWDLYVIRKNNGRNKFSRNGTLLVENDGGATFDGLFINTGGCCGGETSNAQIAEVILMNNSLSDADTLNLETYLATKWGLRSALSTSHPAYIAPPPNMEAPINGFPVNNVQVWLDASKFTQDGQQIPKWNPSTKDGKYFLQNVSNNAGTYPVVKANGLNKLSTLIFKGEYNMGLNAGLSSPAYTLAYVARQTGPRFNRLIGGNGNKLFGHWGGRKNVIHIEGWVGSTDSKFATGNTEWDLNVFRRTAQGQTTFIRNGTVVFANGGGGTGFDGLQINQVEPGDGEVAEIFMWNRFISDAEEIALETYLASKWVCVVY